MPVFELLTDPDEDLVEILVFDGKELVEATAVTDSIEEAVGLTVSDTLGPFDIEPEPEMLGLPDITAEPVIVLLRAPVIDAFPIADEEGETLRVFVCVTDPDTVADIGAVRVILRDPDPVTDTVDVLDEDTDRVFVTDAVGVLVCREDVVVVLVDRIDTVSVGLAVYVLELVTVREELGDPVLVFEADDEPEIDPVIFAVRVFSIVLENVADALLVFEGRTLIVLDGDTVDVLDDELDRDPVGLELLVFDVDTDAVPVLVSTGETDNREVPVAVLDAFDVGVRPPVLLPVLDTVVVFVEVIELVVVFVDVVERVLTPVILDDRVVVVVFVDVLDGVLDRVGTTISRRGPSHETRV